MNPIGKAATASSPSSGLVPQQQALVGQLLFSSDFDGGNMGRVERFPSPSEPAATNTIIRSHTCSTQTSCEEYVVTVAPDCCGTEYENGYRTWFYFGVKVAVHADLPNTQSVPIVDLSTATSPTHEAMSISSLHTPERAVEQCNLRTFLEDDDLDRASASAEGSEHGGRMGDEDMEAAGGNIPNAFLGNTESHLNDDRATEVSACNAMECSTDRVALLEEDVTVQLVVTKMNNQGRLFKQGWRPWFRNLQVSPTWQQLPDSAEAAFSYEWGGDANEGGSGMTIRWRQHLLCNGSTYYFAFCTPLGYIETHCLISRLENIFTRNTMEPARIQKSPMKIINSTYLMHEAAEFRCDPSKQPPYSSEEPLKCIADVLQDDYVPSMGQHIYFHRQELHQTPEHRVVDLLTITAHDGDCMECFEAPPPELQIKGDHPRSFPNRPIVFISARVHPGETPAQFVFFGVVRFLLSNDPRAVELRSRFTFKLVPILNPDGVARGHYRTNTRGLNLNRYYDNPTREEHEGVWAAKTILMHWAAQHRLLFYLDLHGHATKRGCFFLANKLSGMAHAWNVGYARLMQVNSPYFDLDACDFAESSAAFDKGRDGFSKEGTGRVSIHRDCNLCHVYTLECNYHSGRLTRAVPAAAGLPAAMESPSTRLKAEEDVTYTPAVWGQVGEAICVSVLDLYGHNCNSRLPGSRFGSVARLLSTCPSLRVRSGCRGSSDVMPYFPESASIEAISAREWCCGNSSCGWRIRGRVVSKGMQKGGSSISPSPASAHAQRISQNVSSNMQRRSASCSPKSSEVTLPPRPPPQQQVHEAHRSAVIGLESTHVTTTRSKPSIATSSTVRRRASTDSHGSRNLPRRRSVENMSNGSLENGRGNARC